MDHFFSIENLGVQCFPQCGSCKCVKCSLGRRNFTIQEELRMIEDGFVYDEKANEWVATFPVI